MNSPHYRTAALSIALTALIGEAASGATVPRDLVGKSVVITWYTTRTFQFPSEGDQQIHITNTSYVMSFYFSTQGRIFARFNTIWARGNRSFDTVGSDPHRSHDAPDSGATTFQDMRFEGRTLIGLQMSGANMIRRTEVNFNDDASSCTARLTYARNVRVPKNEINYHRDWNGAIQRTIESHSSTPECSVKSGNVFE
jgi:hypothetical protein